MGQRLSQPKGPAGTTEASTSLKPAPPPPTPTRPWGNRRLNSRTLVAPAAALTMALLLFVYARTSIRAAKANAKRHRDADTGGGGINLYEESKRRHGASQRLEEGGMFRQLAATAREDLFGGSGAGEKGGKDVAVKAAGEAKRDVKSEELEKLRIAMEKGGS